MYMYICTKSIFTVHKKGIFLCGFSKNNTIPVFLSTIFDGSNPISPPPELGGGGSDFLAGAGDGV